MQQFQEERLWAAASCLQSLTNCIQWTVEWAQERKLFGGHPGRPAVGAVQAGRTQDRGGKPARTDLPGLRAVCAGAGRAGAGQHGQAQGRAAEPHHSRWLPAVLGWHGLHLGEQGVAHVPRRPPGLHRRGCRRGDTLTRLPSLEGALINAGDVTRQGEPSTGLARRVDIAHQGLAIFQADHTAACSGKIAESFFESTSSAAVSARALSLRRSSRSSSWMRFLSARVSLGAARASPGSAKACVASCRQRSSSLGYSPPLPQSRSPVVTASLPPDPSSLVRILPFPHLVIAPGFRSYRGDN
jgi:hypothetical protein